MVHSFSLACLLLNTYLLFNQSSSPSTQKSEMNQNDLYFTVFYGSNNLVISYIFGWQLPYFRCIADSNQFKQFVRQNTSSTFIHLNTPKYSSNFECIQDAEPFEDFFLWTNDKEWNNANIFNCRLPHIWYLFRNIFFLVSYVKI